MRIIRLINEGRDFGQVVNCVVVALFVLDVVVVSVNKNVKKI